MKRECQGSRIKNSIGHRSKLTLPRLKSKECQFEDTNNFFYVCNIRNLRKKRDEIVSCIITVKMLFFYYVDWVKNL